ncbi:MAG: peptidylprolyl isomerase, partial [Aeoliella sp.]
MRVDCLLNVLLTLSFVTQVASAQPPAAPAAEETSPQAKFDQAVASYKEAIHQIETLRGDYQSADPAAREAINADLADLVATTKAKVDALTTAALEAYQAEPNANPEITQLLVSMAHHLAIGHRAVDPRTGRPSESDKQMGGGFVGGDQPEESLELLTLLIDGGTADPKLPAWAGVCAICANDFELAQKYLTTASESGQFEGLPQFPDDTTSPEVSYRMKARDWFANLEEMRANWEAEEKIRAAEAAADDLPRVKFTTSKGEIVIELFENEAPIATANMISLVKKGFYDGVVFHRVLSSFMAQGGDPTGTGTGGPGHNIKCECHQPNARNHFRGTLSMAHAGRDTGGSQFFLTFVPTDMLNGRHTAFGRVIEGME